MILHHEQLPRHCPKGQGTLNKLWMHGGSNALKPASGGSDAPAPAFHPTQKHGMPIASSLLSLTLESRKFEYDGPPTPKA